MKFIRKITFMNLVFLKYDGYLSSIIFESSIFRKFKVFFTFQEKPRQNWMIFDHVMNFLKLDVLWKKKLAYTRHIREKPKSQKLIL
jgi:hypothetical protein